MLRTQLGTNWPKYILDCFRKILEEVVRNDILISSQNSLDKFCMPLKSMPQIVMLQISHPNTVNPKDTNWILLRHDGKTCWHLFSMSNPWCFSMNRQPWLYYKHYSDLHSQACTKVSEIVCQCGPGWCMQDAASMCVQHQSCWKSQWHRWSLSRTPVWIQVPFCLLSLRNLFLRK